MMKRRQRLKSGILPERLRERAGNLAYVMRPDEASGLCGHGTGGERAGGRRKTRRSGKKLLIRLGRRKRRRRRRRRRESFHDDDGDGEKEWPSLSLLSSVFRCRAIPDLTNGLRRRENLFAVAAVAA